MSKGKFERPKDEVVNLNPRYSRKEVMDEMLERTPPEIREKMARVIEASQQGKTNEMVREHLGVVDKGEAQRLKDATGLDLEGYEHTVDNHGIRHIYTNHGERGHELLRGQREVTPQDIELIPAIIKEYDSAEYAGKSRLGRDVIKYTKRINGEVYYVEEVRTGKIQLAAKSMWASDAGVLRATSEKEGVAVTSETHTGKADNSQDAPEVKGDSKTRHSRTNDAIIDSATSPDERRVLERHISPASKTLWEKANKILDGDMQELAADLKSHAVLRIPPKVVCFTASLKAFFKGIVQDIVEDIVLVAVFTARFPRTISQDCYGISSFLSRRFPLNRPSRLHPPPLPVDDIKSHWRDKTIFHQIIQGRQQGLS